MTAQPDDLGVVVSTDGSYVLLWERRNAVVEWVAVPHA